jgi:hypothetical protein
MSPPSLQNAPAVESTRSARFGVAWLPLVFLFTLAALFCLRPAPAGAYLYWGTESGVARADLNGHGLDTSFVRDPIEHNSTNGVALSGRYVYFGGNVGRVGRASLEGGNIEPDLFTIPQPAPESLLHSIEQDAHSLAVTETYIYWSGDGDLDGTEDGYIGRATIAGGDIEPEFIKTDAPAHSITVYAGHLYWCTRHGIARANLNGSGVEPNFIPVEGPCQIAVAGGYIYWSSFLGQSIGRADIDGRAVDQRFITGLAHVFGVAVGGGYIYWDAEENPEDKLDRSGPVWTGRANINGTDIRQRFIRTPRITGRLAVNALGPGSRSQVRHIRPGHKHRRR